VGAQRPALRALVLAAGRGERLRPLTDEIPKPLLPVAGRPLAAWTLDRLAAEGGAAAALNLHHLGADVRAALGETHGRLPLVYSEERELLGTGGALPPLAEFLAAGERFVVINGDSLCRWPLRRLVSTHRRSGAAATLLVHRTADPRGFGGGVALEGRRIVAFRAGSFAGETARVRRVFAGAAVLSRELLERLPAGRSDIVTALYEPLLADGGLITALETSRVWFDLGTPARYLEAALGWALRGRPARGAWIAPDATVGSGARLRRAVVEAGATVADGAVVRDSVVLGGASIGSGARLERTIVGPGVEVAAGERLQGALVTRSPAGERIATPL